MLSAMRGMRSWTVFCALAASAAAALAAGTAGQAGASSLSLWQCVGPRAAWSGAREIELGDALNRYTGLYSTPVLGLLEASGRVLLLTAGAAVPRGAPGAMTAGPTDREFAARRHRFAAAPYGPGHGPDTVICVREPEGREHGLEVAGRDGVRLASGKSVFLADPSHPAIAVEVRAAGGEPMNLLGVAALAGRLGMYAGLMRERGVARANVAVQGPRGAVVFRSVPEALTGGATLARAAGTIDVALGDAREPAPPAPPAAAFAEDAVHAPAPQPAGVPAAADTGEVRPALPAPQAPTLTEAAVPAPQPVRALAAAGAPGIRLAPAPSAGSVQAAERSYEWALRQLQARHAAGTVRSISEATAVHPAVEAFRAALR